MVISKAGNPAHYLRSQQGTVNEYAFDAAFGAGSTQAEVYENTAKRHVPAVLDGCNVTVFAYGALATWQREEGPEADSGMRS